MPEALPPPAQSRPLQKKDWALAAALVLATMAAYVPALRGELVWDDDSWTTAILHLLRDAAGLKRMWTDCLALQQYFPLTGTTFWLDYQLWGLWTLPYHIENVLLHAAAALLFWRLLSRLEVRGAWLAAFGFALHPVMVESVAWITERKNVLSLALFLWALLAYGRYSGFWGAAAGASTPDSRAVPDGSWRAYFQALGLFTLAMLAKTTAFSFPPVVLVLAWWKRGTLRWRRDLLPILPFFAVSVSYGLLTSWVEHRHVGASGADWDISFPNRCLIAGRALWFYLGKLIWPMDLCFVYPRWRPDAGALFEWIWPAGIIAVLMALWLGRARIGRGGLTAMLLYMGTLFPLLGFINGYFMRYSFVCDHWVYQPSLALFALGAAAVTSGCSRLRLPVPAQVASAVILLGLLGGATWLQAGMYRNMETLWTTALARNPAAVMARNNYGTLLLQLGRPDEALAQFHKAIELQPDSLDARNNLGAALLQLGRVPEAIVELESALTLRPDSVQTHNNLGHALLAQGKLEAALARFQKAVDIAPDLESARYNLGSTLLQAGRVPEAIPHLQRAVELQPEAAEAHSNFGHALLRAGRVDEALSHFEKVAKWQPDSPAAHHNLGNALFQQGQLERAVEQFQAAIALKPGFAPAHNGLGNTCMRLGRLEEAAAQFDLALQQDPKLAEAHFNRANLFLQRGDFAQAIVHYQSVLALEPSLVGAHVNLGNALLRTGQLDDAIAHLRQATQLEPNLAEARNGLGNALFQKGRPAEAVAEYQAAVASRPDQPMLLNNLAWALATCPESAVRNGRKAVELALEADRLSGGSSPWILGTLAAAYAEAGRFSEATNAAQRALDSATAQGDTTQTQTLQARLKLYQAGQPFRDQDLQPKNP